jgi:hypothetical protein
LRIGDTPSIVREIAKGASMLRALLISMTLVLALPAMAQAAVTPADRQAINVKADAFFFTLNQGKTAQAYDAIFLPIIRNQPETVSGLVTQTDQILAFFAAPFRHELVEEKTLGNNLVYRKYILLSDKVPFVVTMVMYRTQAGWLCQNIQLRDLKVEDVSGE